MPALKSILSIVIVVAFLIPYEAHSQNLVSNPGFETVSAEPYWGCEVSDATGWINPAGNSCPNNNSGTPDLFSVFSSGQAALPNTFMGTVNAHSGYRCAGLVTYHQQLANYREYLMTQLSCPLVPGQTYTISFWSTGANPPLYIYHSNNIDICFSDTALIQSGYNLIPGITPQIEITNMVTDTTWTYYSFNFTPTQSYSYMTIGNFRNDASTQIQIFGTYRPYSYYFFDDISVVPIGPNSFSLGPDTSLCSGFHYTLTTGVPNTVWSTGDTATQITISNQGTYWATINTGCVSLSDTITIGQIPSPTVNLGTDTSLCTGQSLLLDATNINSSYVWQDNSSGALYAVHSAGSYAVTVTNGLGCSASDSIHISYNTHPPTVDLGKDREICGLKSVVLNPGIPDAQYLWNDNSTDSVLTVSTSGLYAVTVTTGCGSGTDEVNVQFHTNKCALTFPTAFSPNGDGTNDIFSAICPCPISRYTLHIYNRWGELVFETTDDKEGWNGIFREVPQPIGVFVYYADYFNTCEQGMKELSGNITLLR